MEVWQGKKQVARWSDSSDRLSKPLYLDVKVSALNIFGL